MVVAVVRSKYAVSRSPVQTRLELCTGIVGIMVIGRRPASPLVTVIILYEAFALNPKEPRLRVYRSEAR